MVLFFLFHQEHKADITSPTLICATSGLLKGFELGSIAGVGIGAGTGLLKSNINLQSLILHTTKTTRNIGLVAGPALGVGYMLSTCASQTEEENRSWAWELKEDVWMNRVDTLALSGAVYGAFASRQAVWTNILRMPGKGILGGGICYAAMAGMVVDVPLSIFGPVYLASKEDFNFNKDIFDLSHGVPLSSHLKVMAEE